MPRAEDRVVLVAAANEPEGKAIARDVLAAGGKVAGAVTRAWQVEKLREELADGGDRVLIGHVAPRDAQAAAGLVKGATDALGTITEFVGVAASRRDRNAGGEPAADLEELLDANLHTNATLARALLPRMRRRGEGRMRFLALLPDAVELSATCRASLGALHAFVAAMQLDAGAIEISCEPLPAR